ncbi:hypothetical protein [Endozoicomonas sp. ALC066]|uniref:hypothetical protein n=1 Tax=Endozoicomonas sp. ALC066 TaxID=3403078 RepID=UPI003BB6F52D
MNVFNKEHSQFAAKQLELPEDWELVYQSIDLPFIYDSRDVSDLLKKDEEDFELDDIETAVHEATIHVRLPKGFRLVGLKSPETGERHYGLVDFNPIE